MFFRTSQYQFAAKPERPDPLFAKMLQEPLGGQWGEISVMMTYLFQGWNCRGPQKYKDMILDIGTEEIGHGDACNHDRASAGDLAGRTAGGHGQELAPRSG